MAWLGSGDITDHICDGITLTAYYSRADEELHRLAEEMGVFDPEDIGIEGDVAGTTLVKGASQSGSSLIVDGFTESTGDIDSGMRLKIAGLEYVYELTADATISGSEATLTISPDLESSPADNAAVTFRALHEGVRQWMIAWLVKKVCFDHIGKNNIETLEQDKYWVKWKIYKDEENALKSRITMEMISNSVESITDTAPSSGQLLRG